MEKTEKIKKRQLFTVEEDEKLRSLVMDTTDTVDDFILKWEKIAKKMGNRTPRQCKERWNGYLDPNLNKDPWTQEEDDILVEKVNEFGKKWTKISKFFVNRTPSSLRHRFDVLERKKLKKKSERNPEKKLNSDDIINNLFGTGEDIDKMFDSSEEEKSTSSDNFNEDIDNFFQNNSDEDHYNFDFPSLQ